MADPNTTNKPRSWRSDAGTWIDAYNPLGLRWLGHWLIGREIMRISAGVTNMERNLILRKVGADIVTDMKAKIAAKEAGNGNA